MKRIVLLFLICIFVLCGCGSDNSGSPNYSIPDIIKQNLMWNVNEITQKQSVYEVLSNDNGIASLLIEGENKSKIFAFYGTPKGEKPKSGFPAMLLLHGGGGKAFPDWVRYWNDLGFAAIALDLGGQMVDEYGITVKNPYFTATGSYGSVGGSLVAPGCYDSWTYQVIAFCMHANNFLRSQKDINANQIGVTGISWGGFVTCILSGVDKRFSAFAPVYGCGNLTEDSWGKTVAGTSAFTKERAEAWAEVYDPLAYLPYATKPMLFITGATDHAFSIQSQKKSTSLVPGKVFYSYYKELTHGHYWNLTPSVVTFMKHVLSGDGMSVNVTESSVSEDGTKLYFKVEEVSSVWDKGNLVYTTDTDSDSHNWQWQTERVDLDFSLGYVNIPENATACFLQLMPLDEEDSSYFSTDVYLFE